MSKPKKRLNEKKQLTRFVESLINKNYKQAHKYLMSTVEYRLKTRIGAQLDKPLF
jgi:hypothetical protein